MDKYQATKQYTLVGGLALHFYVDAQAAASIINKTCITYKGIKYNMHAENKGVAIVLPGNITTIVNMRGRTDSL